MRSRWLKTQQDWPGGPGWTEVGAEGPSLLWGNTTLQRFSFTFLFFFNWESPNFSALGLQIEDMVKANPMELPKCQGAGGSDLRDSADATRHRNPAGGQNPTLCYLALKITWKRKSRDLYPCGVLRGVWKKAGWDLSWKQGFLSLAMGNFWH